MTTSIYYLGIAFLFTHEMDAVMHAEWQLLYLLRDLNSDLAYTVFVALHVPAFFLFFWLGHHDSDRIRQTFRGLTAAFLIVHAAIHAYSADAPANQFSGIFSYSLIYVAALLGLCYLAIDLRSRRRKTT